jgi:hypothetical protein
MVDPPGLMGWQSEEQIKDPHTRALKL